MYLSVDESNTLIEILELQYPNLCQVFTLNWQTFEGRDVKAIRIKTDSNRAKHGILIIAGLHAREWGNTDIAMHFLQNLLTAYTNASNIQYGSQTYLSTDIQVAMDSVELFIIPVVNPDGKSYSFESGDSEAGYPKSMWRKNRRDNNWGLCFGVDLNRNFDWLWHYRQTIHPQAWMENASYCQGYIAVSDFPCDSTYHGPAPFSEPETRNVRDLLDENPHIRYFVDVHGTGGYVLRPWSDDEIQTQDPGMSFKNDQYDGLRGLADTNISSWGTCPPPHADGVAYKNYMDAVDDARLTELAEVQVNAVNAVRGQAYVHGPGFTTLYGITGGTKDYIYSRHLTNPAAGKVDTFLYEYGINTGFQPPYDDPAAADDMLRVMDDCAAGLTTLLLKADTVPIVVIAPNPLDLGKQRTGTTKNAVIGVTNRGPQPSVIANVTLIENTNGVFSVTSPSPPGVATGETRSIVVTSNPNVTGMQHALLQIEFHHQAGGLRDTRVVTCKVDVCSAPAKACVAPVFGKMNVFECLLLYLTVPVLIAALSIFIWIPGILCVILRLIFLLNNCSKGNDDPCIVLMKNRWGFSR